MLYSFKYDFDKSRLLNEARDEIGYEPFKDPKTGGITEEWRIKRDVTGYAAVISEEFEKILSVENKPRFYIQEKGFTLPFHQDRGTRCCINFVLSTDRDPITFRRGHNTFTFRYDVALLNVQEEHMVTASHEDRVLFKLSIFDIDFDDALERIQRYESYQESRR